MIVDAQTLDVLPIADKVMETFTGEPASMWIWVRSASPMSWSCVIEFKTSSPAPALYQLEGKFQDHVRQVNELLHPMGAMLMPGAMHPLMNPDVETRIWEHEYTEVYHIRPILAAKGMAGPIFKVPILIYRFQVMRSFP